jgi:hypothetical protein
MPVPDVRAHEWIKEFRGAITVCDPGGVILEMNDAAIRSNAADGGAKLIGTNLLACHPEPSLSKVKAFMAQREPNVYTIEKRGVKKLVYQTWWDREGRVGGFMEIVLEIPFDLPHFVRQP